MKKTHKIIEKIEVLNLVFVGAGAVLGWITGIIHVPSFLLGGGVMQAHFWLLKKTVRSAIAPSDSQGPQMKKALSAKVTAGHPPSSRNFSLNRKSRVVLWLAVKAGLYAVLLSAVFVPYPLDARSFAAGVPLLLIACVIIGLSRPKDQPDPPSPLR